MQGPSLHIVQHRLTSPIDICSFGLRGPGRGRVLLGSINNYTSPCPQLHPGRILFPTLSHQNMCIISSCKYQSSAILTLLNINIYTIIWTLSLLNGPTVQLFQTSILSSNLLNKIMSSQILEFERAIGCFQQGEDAFRMILQIFCILMYNKDVKIGELQL